MSVNFKITEVYIMLEKIESILKILSAILASAIVIAESINKIGKEVNNLKMLTTEKEKEDEIT